MKLWYTDCLRHRKLYVMMSEDVWSLMTSTFIYDRRRSRKQFEEVCSKSSYHIIEIRRAEGKLRGFFGFWEMNNWIVIEHVAVQKDESYDEVVDELRLKLEELYTSDYIIVKEVDIIDNKENKLLKQIFCDKGFIQNPYVYIQPSFHKECASFPQRILSYPMPITYAQFKELRALLYKHVYGKMQMC